MTTSARTAPRPAPAALPDDATLIRETEALALALLERSEVLMSGAERRRGRRLASLIGDVRGRDLLLDLTDQVLRIRDPRRSARRLHDLAETGIPDALVPTDRLGLRMLGRIAPAIPRIADRAVDWRVDRDTAGVILPADDPGFATYLRGRRSDGFRLNVNVLGEAILGDDEAEERCRKVIACIERPDVDYVSVKISALCANLDVLAEEHSVDRISNQLRRLYRAALASTPATFVNLDMEEYRDLELSLASFMRVLSEPEFHGLAAGIVLQAYIPDSHGALERLCSWANQRYEAGGAGVKIRLVKGANLAMEQVEAELHDWPQAPYATKTEVDSSYKRMLERALEIGSPGAVRLGIASHNLFEIAYAVTVAGHLRALDRIDLEMLEGMAPAQARAVREWFGDLLLYAPIVDRSDRDASIAYLSRRLDENAAPDNFLRSLFDITPGSPAWTLEAERFRGSVSGRHSVGTTSHRATRPDVVAADGAFRNAPDTDVTQAASREWIARALIETEPQEPGLVATVDDVDALVSSSAAAQEAWRGTPWSERRTALLRVAELMEQERGTTVALMAHTAGKTVAEGDPEVSEAIDFARYAAHLTEQHESITADGLTWTPMRVVVVAGPWNFPYAIPASGIVHALAAGCAVIMKPAPETRAVAAHLVDQVRRAGLPHDLVQLAATPDDEVGQRLITHEDVDLVMLTGSIETARLFHGWKPSLTLQAETSGKNALVITAAADIDQAIKDLVRSAFGHSGQKCSAASLAIVEAAVYDDPTFRRRLADATTSLVVGSALDPATKAGPLISAPSGNLLRALTQLEPGEEWLVAPRRLSDDATVWSPGIRLDVQPGSWFHRTECFGPVLGLMRADSLDHALALQNATEYGLTGGLHSLDPLEIDHWLRQVEVGNAYVNRHITGAIVQRQPFGGWKASSIGPGHKPGGPSHLHGYGRWSERVTDSGRAAASFDAAWNGHFSLENDATGLAAESNVLRYRALESVALLAPADAEGPRDLARLAADTCGVALSLHSTEEEVLAWLEQVPRAAFARVRAPLGASESLLAVAHASGITVDTSPLTGDGRAELPHWLLEQAVSRTMHRYGRVLTR